jgi:hypothetical protein
MAEKSELAKLLPGQVEVLEPGDAVIEVWAGELQGRKTVVLCCSTSRDAKVWVHAHVTPAQARVLSRAFAEAAGDLDTN